MKSMVDPNNPKEMALFGAACVMAKHFAYADGEAFFGGWAATATPVSVWAALKPGDKELWIQRAMRALENLHTGRDIVHLARPDNVIAAILPQGAA